MMIAQTIGAYCAVTLVVIACTSPALSDTAADLATCETTLKNTHAIRHTVVWPAAKMGISVGGGGPSSLDWTDQWPFTKSYIISQVGLGDPSRQTIESAITVDRDVTGDASAEVSFSGDTILFKIHIHKGWFGGGATAKARLQVVFLESSSDDLISSIGRICAAKIFGKAKP